MRLIMKKSLMIQFLTVILLAVFMVSCTKDENKISGIITYNPLLGDSRPANGATVNLISNDEYKKITTTDENGYYRFTDVEDGTYHVQAQFTATLIQYKGQSNKFTVEGDDNITVSFELEADI